MKSALAGTLFPVLLFASLPVGAVQDYATAQYRLISESECINVGRLRTQFDPVSPNLTFIHVRHMGDPYTAEWQNQIANAVTWNVGTYTGLNIPLYPYLYQRGYYNQGPPIGTNAYQVNCHSAGFMINSFQFSHTQDPLPPPGYTNASGGPNVTYWRQFSPRRQVYRNPSSELTLQAYVRLPWVHYDPSDPGTALGVLFATLHDETSGIEFFFVSQFFDSRLFGDFNGNEFVGYDGFLTFSSSPLTDLTASGTPLKYATRSPYSASMHNQYAWSGERFLRVHLPWSKLPAIVSDIKSAHPTTHSSMSMNPADYTLSQAGVIYELYLGENLDKDISIGTSLRYFEVYEAFDY